MKRNVSILTNAFLKKKVFLKVKSLTKNKTFIVAKNASELKVSFLVLCYFQASSYIHLKECKQVSAIVTGSGGRATGLLH